MSANDSAVDAPITLSHKGFVDYAFAMWLDCLTTGRKPKTLCLLGPPGIGKSSVAYALRKRMSEYVAQHPEVLCGEGASAAVKKQVAEQEAVCRLLDFSSMLPEDLNGLPFREKDYTRYCPQEWVSELCGEHSYGVVVQDDLPAAAPAMHTAGRQMALERRIHNHKFAPGILIIVTGNRREDKSAASTLPSHFLNSVCLMTVEPDVEEWKRWYGEQPHSNSIVSAFLTWKPGLLSQLPRESDKVGAFATPRQWASLGEQFKVASKAGGSVLLAVAAGLVGKAAATTFCSFVEIHNKLPDPNRVFDTPKEFMPDPEAVLDEPSKNIAMACALGEIAASRSKGAKGKKQDIVAEKLLVSLAHTCAHAREYSATGIQTFLDNGGEIFTLVNAARKNKKDKVIGEMVKHIIDALSG